MNANELRIKNYVYDDENIVVQIEQIQSKELSEWNTDEIKIITSIGGAMYDTEFDKIKPIPLTENILLKCGFKKEGNLIKTYDIKCVNIKKFSLLFSENKLFFIPNWQIDWSVELKYIHELQNLYFALTGSELVFSTEP